MKVLIADCEADGFLDTMTRLWTIQIGEAEGDEVTVYADQPGFPPLSEAAARLKTADRVVFHNGQKFDIHAINRFFPGTLDPHTVWDTLVAARLLNPSEKANSLEEWGKRLGEFKGEFKDFSRFSQEMVDYGRQDIVVTRKLYHLLEPKLRGWGESVELENLFAYCIGLQEHNGFRLNVDKVRSLEAELRQEADDLERQLQDVFPPWWRPDVRAGTAIVKPKVGKVTGKSQTVKDVPYTRVKLESFNPGSRSQIADRLKARYGWKPKAYTESGAPKVDEAVLATLKFPEAKLLSRYFRIIKQLGQIADGDNGWLKLVNEKTSRVHGAVNTNGAATGRCSHFKPNMAQVDKKDLRMRECWEARPGWKLVGVDAEGLELRMLAHYLGKYDKGRLAKALLEGRKEDGTDAHSINQKATGLYKRDNAKRLLYALMYGAGDAKLGEIIKEDAREAGKTVKGSATELGKKARADLAKGMKGLDKLVGLVKEKARQKGYIKGLDGRHIQIKSEHSAFNFLLQGGGAIVMKKALVLFHFHYSARFGPYGQNWAYCANVHDEVQSETAPDIAEDYAKTLADCIRLAGEHFSMRCPLAGAFDIGTNWKDTH